MTEETTMGEDWILVTQRLPKNWQRVLIYDPQICDDESIALMIFHDGEWLPDSEDEQPNYDYEPTHWMPLPPKPTTNPPQDAAPPTR
jgi:hypothetical protein